MMDAAMIEWVIAIFLVAIFGGAIYWLLVQVPKARLMRCPDTGAVVFVDVADAPGASGADAPCVHQCELWPGRKNCARGCLARYAESGPGYRVSLNALRPFEPQ